MAMKWATDFPKGSLAMRTSDPWREVEMMGETQVDERGGYLTVGRKHAMHSYHTLRVYVRATVRS